MNETLWSRIEAALDARVDPFADAGLAAELARDPEATAALRRLLSRLALLPTAPNLPLTPAPSLQPTPTPSLQPTPTPSLQPTPTPSLQPTPTPTSGPAAPRRTARRRLLELATGSVLIALAALLLRTHQLLLPGQTRPAPQLVRSISLVVEHSSPPPALGARVILEPRRVQGWTLEGTAP